MTDQSESGDSTLNGGQLGIAALAVSLCAACGFAWLSNDPGASTSSFAPTQSDGSRVTTASASGEGGAQTGTFTAQTTPATGQYAIIVKFSGDPVPSELGKTFRKDPEGTRARFNAWAADKPALRGLSLERASYSGELVLIGSGAPSMKDAIAAIEAMDNVAYVEPDYSARPSKEG